MQRWVMLHWASRTNLPTPALPDPLRMRRGRAGTSWTARQIPAGWVESATEDDRILLPLLPPSRMAFFQILKLLNQGQLQWPRQFWTRVSMEVPLP